MTRLIRPTTRPLLVLLVALLVAATTLTGCKKDTTKPGPSTPCQVRTGAVCNDGTTSTATGSGACSHHGGVKYWTYRPCKADSIR